MQKSFSHKPNNFRQPKKLGWGLRFLILGVLALPILIWNGRREQQFPSEKNPFGYLPQLAMSGGDPYVRALMRTISASESNAEEPYVLLYGGDHFHNFNQHPNVCVKIARGPNRRKCSTAAGRYQFLASTWLEKARKYHPHPHGSTGLSIYSFEPKYQDKVTYKWLKDRRIWGTDIAFLLRQGRVDEVLKMLSGTWTSLGYGIEDNWVTPHLAKIYQQVLAEELLRVQSSGDRDR
ncbi:glycoside hydrolase family protein [Chroococcidiopsis sp. CCNUC1]|jgi:cation efflux system protein involved in nickel and cobalt tolerance|uniref:glycoside hydrolase family 24 protein n=1 Tax=Chroococcidiopsis sp. CCNUC1 TaxID=2653189 RepID=UPI002021825D|nr:glycoside hydrolase family protein [Chroococcidiopsis sp. CCNUC1]URD53367.1 glycoside hydrolase family protein [Chroococcidiopsis sp. CCNUC1]